MGRHGGGAFSGKDPSKVDRSAAYMGRWVAKNIVAAGLATTLRSPIRLRHRSSRAGQRAHQHLRHATPSPKKRSSAPCNRIFSFKPADIIKQLNLLRPIYSKTTNYGHFGKIDDPDITWEKTDKAAALKKAREIT